MVIPNGRLPVCQSKPRPEQVFRQANDLVRPDEQGLERRSVAQAAAERN
jgi:hypothetical protein